MPGIESLASLFSGTSPYSGIAQAGLQGVSTIADLVGSFTQAKEARNQRERQRSFGAGQTQKLKEGVRNISDLIKGTSTYQADTELFQKAQEQSELQQRQSSAQGRVAGEGIARQQVEQNAANSMAQARLGARSGTDLMTAALLNQNISGGQQLEIDKQSMLQKQARIDSANQQYMNSLYQTAGETARQRQLAFTSQAQKEQQLIGFQQTALQTELGQDYQIFQDDKRSSGAYANTLASISGGIGDVFRGISSGMMASSAADSQLKLLKDLLKR